MMAGIGGYYQYINQPCICICTPNSNSLVQCGVCAKTLHSRTNTYNNTAIVNVLYTGVQ